VDSAEKEVLLVVVLEVDLAEKEVQEVALEAAVKEALLVVVLEVDPAEREALEV